MTVLLGVAVLIIGVLLIASPFRSLTVLAALVSAALVLSGVAVIIDDAHENSSLTRLRRMVDLVVGAAWIIAGVTAAVYPGITVGVLAIAIGIVLVVGGIGEVVGSLMERGVGSSKRLAADERFVRLLSGITNVLIGALALSWPEATVLVIAVLFGARTSLYGIGRIVRGLRRRSSRTSSELESLAPGPRMSVRMRAIGAVLAFLLAIGATVLSAAVHRASPPGPGPFYTASSPLPSGPPGTIIRTEVIDDFHPDATTYRVLYLSTSYDGEPTAVSGLIVVPNAPAPAGGRNVVAYTHGTVGVASNCAPSAQGPKWAPVMEGLDEFVSAGYVIAATDYQGLGTKGPHPYLVGASEAMNELDNVRAARNFAPADASADFAVWGHSQGGHASLFTGQLAASYAPELHLVGVAAGAPVPDLVDLFKVNLTTTIGKVLISMALQSWARVYDAASLDQIVTPAARPIVAKVAKTCLYSQTAILGAVPSTLVLGLTFVSNPPWDTEPWRSITKLNNPGGSAFDVPVLITQGTADPIVDPGVTEKFVAKLCAAGETVDLRLYPGVRHVDAGLIAAPDVAAWIGDRFAGRAASSTC